MAKSPLITVLIVSRARGPHLRSCLESLLNQVAPPPWELVVGANGDPSVATHVRALFPDARVEDIPRAHPGEARNAAVKVASGETILFLDDDVQADPRLLAKLDELIRRHPESGVFGGPNLTPPGSSSFQVVQGAVLSSLISSGPVRRRYGPHPAGYADERFFMLCNMAVRRDVLLAFDESLICAEENQLLNELSRAGVKMLYDPSLIAFHDRRGDLKGFIRQLFKYGVGRGQVITRDPASLRLAHVTPVILLSYLLALPGLFFLSPLWLGGIAVYLTLVLLNGTVVAATLRSPKAFLPAAGLTAVVHLAYASGTIAGVFRGPRSKSKR